jgi:hypothetical protein
MDFSQSELNYGRRLLGLGGLVQLLEDNMA